MFEYIVIGVVGMGLYLFFYFLRKQFFRRNRYYKLIISSVSLFFFGILFFGVIRESATSFNFFTGLLIFLLLYLVFNIIRELFYLSEKRQ